MLGHIRKAINEGELKKAIRDCDNLMQLCLEGLRYLQTYDWLFIQALITVGYLGWIAFSLTAALDQYVLNGKTEACRSIASKAVLGSILAALFVTLYVRNSPCQYYAYFHISCSILGGGPGTPGDMDWYHQGHFKTGIGQRACRKGP